MSVLQRKAKAGKEEHQARAMTVAKAMRISLAKLADDTFDMALAVIGFRRERVSGDGIGDVAGKNALLLLLDLSLIHI